MMAWATKSDEQYSGSFIDDLIKQASEAVDRYPVPEKRTHNEPFPSLDHEAMLTR